MKYLSLLTIFLLPLYLFANASAPGFWNAGAAQKFSLLFPKDRTAYQMLEMAKEQVSIDLYKGYAVVQGKYWMYNHSDERLKLNIGYPINSDKNYWIDSSHVQVDIQLDSLYELEVFVEGRQLPHQLYHGNWHIWENEFEAKDTTLIVVRFIVNTNEAYVSRGYAGDNTNCFVYLLESGASWDFPIGKGEIRVRLNNIPFESFKGIHPRDAFSTDSLGIFRYTFEGMIPKVEDNILIAYSERLEEFEFEEIRKKKDALFTSIKSFSIMPLHEKDMKTFLSENPFRVESGTSFLLNLVFFFAFYPEIVGLIIFVLIFFLFWFFVQRKMK